MSKEIEATMKRYFNTIFFNLVPFALGFFVCYLIGSFVSVSFDPVMWTAEARATTAVFGCIWGLAIWMKLEAEGLV